MKEGFRGQGSGFASILPCSRWMVDGGWWKQRITRTGKRSDSSTVGLSGSATVLRSDCPTDPPPSTRHLPPATQNSSHGFTLIEVTLATVVIGMGLLAVFGLGQLALRNAKATEDDTRAAMLAEDVFASLRTVSENLCASKDPPAWTKFWTDFQNGTTNQLIVEMVF